MKNVNKELYLAPVFFERNRVRRIYLGGALFSGFFGDGSSDGYYPEEWIASAVAALNDNSGRDEVESEGISRVRGTDLLFTDLIDADAPALFGSRRDPGILVKMLDSAIRLPVQAHPDTAFSKKHFGSPYGKTESWVVIDARENACIYYGFSDKIGKDAFSAAVTASETDPTAMESLLNRIPVRPGDVYLIRSGTVHAIGAGCLILETQEPTDFTIQPEAFCGNHRLSKREMYLGLDRDTALNCFDYDGYGTSVVEKGRQIPVTLSEGEGWHLEDLISYEATPCFSVRRLTLTGAAFKGLPKAAVCVVTEGRGTIRFEGGCAPVKKGDYCFLPHCSAADMTLEGDLTAIFCLPPKR